MTLLEVALLAGLAASFAGHVYLAVVLLRAPPRLQPVVEDRVVAAPRRARSLTLVHGPCGHLVFREAGWCHRCGASTDPAARPCGACGRRRRPPVEAGGRSGERSGGGVGEP